MSRQITPEQAVAELMRTVPVLEEEGEQAMQEAVELTYQRMTEYAPRGQTGELARDVTHTVRKTAKGVSGLVKPRARYAPEVEGGTGQGKTLRGARGEAYSATTRHAITHEQELADPFTVMTAYGWGSKTPGKPLALHLGGGQVIFRPRVRGQRARHFVQRTREATAADVERVLAAGAQRATERLFR